MIEINHLSKTFVLKKDNVNAVNDVSLHIKGGEIFGIIGYSGAGKSTLVRCINFLERPESGTIAIDGFGTVRAEKGKLFLIKNEKEKELRDADLRRLRRSIGMIFQHFNLLDRNTVFDNIAYPLKYTGLSRVEIQAKVNELLKLVDLEDKRNVYPSQLSGGQKQRVAIARALADSPKVLLSDEATSALDPDATESILHLLKKLNQELGLTIVIITHEMAVIKEAADRVAVMENGRVVEEGDVYNVFAQPQQTITKKFVESSSGLSNIDKLIATNAVHAEEENDRKLIKLTFTKDAVGNALISEVSRDYSVDVSIVLANVDVVSGSALGGIIAEISGTPENIKKSVLFFQEHGVKVEVIHHA
jgi:D-methionine transport system ATP-binding protein